MNEDPGRMDIVRVEFARLDDDFGFGDGELTAGGGVGVEVARGAAVDEIAVEIGLPRFDECHVGAYAALEDVCDAVEIFVLLALCDDGADAGAGIEAWNAGAAGAHALGQCALRAELDFEFTRKKLTLELGIFAHVAGDHFFYLTGFKQHAEAPAIDAGVVAGDGEVAYTRIAQRLNQRLGNAAQAEA